MGIRAALVRLSEIIDGAAPRVAGDDYPARFHHEPTAGEDKLPTTRGWWFEVEDGARKTPFTDGRRRHVRNVAVCLHYASNDNRFEQQIVMEEDRVVITDAILHEDWQEATTGLVAASFGATEALIPTVRARAEGGGYIQRLVMTLEVIE